MWVKKSYMLKKTVPVSVGTYGLPSKKSNTLTDPLVRGASVDII